MARILCALCVLCVLRIFCALWNFVLIYHSLLAPILNCSFQVGAYYPLPLARLCAFWGKGARDGQERGYSGVEVDILGGDGVGGGEDEEALDDIAELADVTRPREFLQRLQCLGF